MDAMETHVEILTRLLPKTGQVTSYDSGDDGEYEAGWWRGLLNDDNKDRFIQQTIGGDDIVIDRATGLMWAGDGNEAGCYNGLDNYWSDILAYTESLTFAGFSDWRVPNINELLSITNRGLVAPSISEPPFSNTLGIYYWSSTTYLTNTILAICVHFGNNNTSAKHKNIDTSQLRAVRGGL